MQIEHPNFLIKIYFVNIKQTTQLQLVPEDKVAILRYRFPMSASLRSLSIHVYYVRMCFRRLTAYTFVQKNGAQSDSK